MLEQTEREKADPLLSWKQRLDVIQSFVVLIYAVALSLPITVPWIVLIVGVVIWASSAALSFRLKTFQRDVPPLAVPILVFVTANIVSGAVNGGFKEAIGSLMTLRTFLVYFWAYYAFGNNAGLKCKAVQTALVMGAIAGLWATVQQVFDVHPGFKFLQGTGFLSGPMAFAGVMQMLSQLGLALILTSGYKQCAPPFNNKWLFGAIAAANVMGLIFASERSAWLGFMVALFLVAGLVSWKILGRALLACSVICVLAWFTVPVVQTRLAPLADWQHEAGMTERLTVWSIAMEQFQKAPILGVGSRNFPHVLIPGPGKTYLDHAHSNYLHILSTLGLVGLCAYLWLSLSALVLTWRNYINAKRDGDAVALALSLGILGGIVSLLVAGIFEYNFGTGNVRLAQWFLLAMLSNVRNP